MARINSELGVVYTDDFGNISPYPLAFKIHAAAPIPSNFYVPRSDVPCSGGGGAFKMRKMFATFAPTQASPNIPKGRFEYPIPTVRGSTGIVALGTALVALGAICIDVVGEKWIRVGKGIIGGNANFKTTPYTDIPGEPEKTGYSFTYDSDVEQIGENLGLSISVESLPASLKNGQISCLNNPIIKVAGSKTICAAGSLGITPRKFIIQALSLSPGDGGASRPPDGTVIRNAIVSKQSPDDHKTCGQGLIPLAYCLGYKGEVIKNLQGLVQLNT